MNSEEKLQEIIAQFRQMLADEQFKAVQLSILVQEGQKRINDLESELEKYRVPSEIEATE